jgi:hypothetical protein
LGHETKERIARWIERVERIPPRAFTDAGRGATLPPEVLAESLYWCDEVFAKEANPHDAPGARRAVHHRSSSAPDLLRHEYVAAGIGLTVIEGRNFLLVVVDPQSLDVPSLPAGERAAAIHDVAARIFRPPGGRARTKDFVLPSEIGEGACFSTSASAEPLLLAAWHERVEGGIRGGRLYFLCYKKTAQQIGFAEEERWFDHARRRRSLGQSASRRRRP